MTFSLKRIFVFFCGALGISLLALGALALRNDPAAERRKVFEQTWLTVNEKFYDRNMNGLDWPAVRKTYLRKLRDTENSTDLYWKVLNPMLALLETSHVGAISPSSAALYDLTDVPQAYVPAGNIDICGGLSMVFPMRVVSARVTKVDTGSFLHMQGVRVNWRMQGWSQSSQEPGSDLKLDFTSTQGETFSFPVNSADPRSPNENAAKEDLKSLSALLIARADPGTILNMESLGLSVTIGKSAALPLVVDVLNGSEAESAGIEPGSTVIQYNRKNGLDGIYTVDAKLVSPSGNAYTAAFKFPKCDLPDRAATLLPGNILLLRFDKFQPDIVPWLDEQLRIKPSAVVIDLRRNAGGDANVLTQVMGRFMDAGIPVIEEIRAEHSKVITAAAAPEVFRQPVAVLISRLSTSAAEVAAGALQFHGRAKLFGQTTGGDVVLSNKFRLADGGIVQVAIADARGLDGRRLENVGVKPDVEIVPTLQTIRAGRDVVLEAALSNLTKTTH